jgi:hypothetical protein
MAVLLYAVEVEVLNELADPDRDKFLREAAEAYRARAVCLQTLGEPARADLDLKRAAKLDAKAKQLSVKAAKPKGPRGDRKNVAQGKNGPKDANRSAKPGRAGRVRLVNEWVQPVTVVIRGVPYLLRAGEQKTIAKPAGPFTYEVLIPHHWARGTLEAGKVYTIRVHSR